MNFVNNTLSAPFFVFIKATGQLTDESLMTRLDLRDYDYLTDDQKNERTATNKTRFFLTEDDQWTHLIDDWTYTLWYDLNFREKVKLLSYDFEIFSCYIGDIDESFGFQYLKEGKAIRTYEVEDPDFKRKQVVINQGISLRGEHNGLSKTDTFEKIISIAKSNGININHSPETLRCYERLERKEESFDFNENEY